jgi:hypothetical protein
VETEILAGDFAGEKTAEARAVLIDFLFFLGLFDGGVSPRGEIVVG